MLRRLILPLLFAGIGAGALFAAVASAPAEPGAPPCTEKDELIPSDPWPRAGEVRRTEGKRRCKQFVLTRGFVSAADGLAAGELFVAEDALWRNGRDEQLPRSYAFVGQLESIYSYAFYRDQRGELSISGSVARSANVTPGLWYFVAGALAAWDGTSLDVHCVKTQSWCELKVWRVAITGTTIYFYVRFDQQWPRGNLCLFVPLPGEGRKATRLSLRADKRSVVANAVANAGAVEHCRGRSSDRALAQIRSAAKLDFRIARGEAYELDTKGLGTALDLARFLYDRTIAHDDRLLIEPRLRQEADQLLEAAD
jgi:hypothetical protein